MKLNLYENRQRGTESLPVGFVRTHMTSKGSYIPIHWHEQIEMQYIISGNGTVTCNQTDYHISAGDFLIIHSYDVHSGFCTLPNLDAFVLVFNLNTFTTSYEKNPFLFQTLIKQDPKIIELMTSIFKEEEEKKEEYITAIRGKLCDLITYLIRNYKQEKVSVVEFQQNKRNLDCLELAIDFIKKNHADPTLSLPQLAEAASLSVSRFSHLFKSALGLSPIAYLNQYRLKKAYALLLDGCLKATEIAFLVGFSDYNNFNRQFQKMYHELPSKIQQKK